jgi:deazaflavin-dependent oxidoreductase (nitroreductase family)
LRFPTFNVNFLSKTVKQPEPNYHQPTPLEGIFNQFFGWLVGMGLGLPHNYLVQIRGRKTGRIRSTPISVLSYKSRVFLIAGRGYTQWVLNAQAAGELSLKKGRVRLEFRLRVVPDEEKPEILKAYLDRFKRTVQRYFPVPADSPLEAFTPLTNRYPVFELIRHSRSE